MKEKVFSMPDGKAVGTLLITVGMDFPPSHQHTHKIRQTHTNRNASCHSTPPAQHLVIKAEPRKWSSLVAKERIIALDYWKGTNTICFLIWLLQL